MEIIEIPFFSGMLPAMDASLLPPQAASYAANCWLYSGSVKGLPTPKLVRTPPAGTIKSFRFPTSYTNPSKFYSTDNWLDFTTLNVDLVRAPVIGDTFDRYYWASDIDNPRYAPRANINAGTPFYLLGIPAPSVAPPVSPAGGASSIVVTRSYVTTWVSAYGEEGAPSPPTVITGKIDDTFTVTLPTAAGGDLGTNRNLTRVRIYRTVVGGSGATNFYEVVDLAIATATYADSLSDQTLTNANIPLPSATWSQPPSDLVGFCMMPNGILAGFRQNEIHFSVPYRPHAWPASYTQVVEKQIVGLGVIGQALVVVTQGYPSVITGVSPDVMTMDTLTTFEPGTSRASILSTPEGVYYSSPNGLIRVVGGAATNITQDLISKDIWQQLTKSASLCAARFGTAYYAIGQSNKSGFDSHGFNPRAFGMSGNFVGFMVDPANPKLGWVNLTSTTSLSSVSTDAFSGEVFVNTNGNISWLCLNDPANPPTPYVWTSKNFKARIPVNMSAMKVWFQVPPGITSANYGNVSIYADGFHVMTRALVATGQLWKMPSGFKADYWQFSFSGSAQLITVQIVGAAKELVLSATPYAT